MKNELTTVTPEVLTKSEQEQLDQNINSLIERYRSNRQEVNRLVFESVSAMTAGDEYEHELASKKGFRRFIGGITGSNKRLQDKINSSRSAAQYASQLTLQRLAEQNLMSFDLITAVNNKLNSSVLAIEGELNEVYATLIKFFKQSRSDVVQLESRVAQLEQNVALLNWQNSIEFQMFDGIEYAELDDAAKIVCMVRDFYNITNGAWKTSDLMLLKAAMSTIGLSPREKTSIAAFLRGVAASPVLMEKLLDGKVIRQLPEPYLVPLLGLKKQELLDTDEAFILDTVEDTLTESGVSADRSKLEEKLIRSYIAQESQVDLNVPLTNYDLMMELLFDLSQATLTGTLGSGTVLKSDSTVPEIEFSKSEKKLLSFKPVDEAKCCKKQVSLTISREKALKEADALYDKARSEFDRSQYDFGYNENIYKETYKEALKYYLMAEDAGKGWAYYRAGQLYECGWGTLEIGSKAYIDTVESLYQKSADLDNSDGQYSLAHFYSFMNLTTRPGYAEKQRKLYQRAAEQGNKNAKYFLEHLPVKSNSTSNQSAHTVYPDVIINVNL